MNCKQGDLAIQIKAVLPENVGILVRVVNFLGDCEWGANAWVCDLMRERAVSDGRHKSRATIAAIPDDWLRPISGIPDTEDTDERQPIKEVA